MSDTGGRALDELLPCGTRTADLLAWVTDGVDPPDPDHSVRCSACQAAVADLRALWGRFEEVAAAPVRMRPGVFDEMMARLRRLLVTGWVVVDDSGSGSTVVSEGVLSAMADRVASSVDGVVAVRSASADQTGGRGIRVSVEIVAGIDVRLPDLADLLRDAIRTQLEVLGEVQVAQVDVQVADLGP